MSFQFKLFVRYKPNQHKNPGILLKMSVTGADTGCSFYMNMSLEMLRMQDLPL